ncbi:MAG TPA: hypothetical protein VN327_11435, partial [Pseudonocardiaceae bacterium]|nr:hypothetical protein [Pseudonocardiaceae bacterium]
IIGWAAPHLLPRAWVAQAADRAVIVTPVKVAPIAQAHLLLRVDLHHGQPTPRDVHAGGFIEMYPEVITEVAVPIRHRDGLHQLNGRETVWVSAPTVRDDPEYARQAAQMIAAGHSVSSPLDDDYPAHSAFYGYLYARQPHGLASAGCGGVGPGSASGIGLVLTDSAAILRPRDMYVAGTGEAEESLRALIKEWTHTGRGEHTALQPILIPAQRASASRCKPRAARKVPGQTGTGRRAGLPAQQRRPGAGPSSTRGRRDPGLTHHRALVP